MSLYLRLLRYTKPYWRKLALAIFCALLVAVFTAAYTWLMKPVLDDVFIKKDMAMLTLLPFAILAVSVGKGVFSYCQGYLLHCVGSRVVMDIREELYRHLILLPLGFHIQHSTGHLMSGVLNDVGLLQAAVASGVKDVVQQVVMAVALTFVIFYQDWKLASAAFLILPFSYYFLFRLGRRIRILSRVGQEKIADLTKVLQETLSGVETVKAFGREEFETQRFREKSRLYFSKIMKAARLSEIGSPVMECIGAVGVAVVIWYGGYQIIRGETTPGSFLSFMAALLLMYTPMKRLIGAYAIIQQALAVGERVFSVLDQRTEKDLNTGLIELPSLREGIRFHDVTFRYNGIGEPILCGISFQARVGEAIALVGSSGSGKTTLVNLIPRFYDPTEGMISIDGIDTRQVTLSSLRRQIGIVSQDVMLFEDTVRNNIAYGSEGVGMDEIVEVAKAAYAHQFIVKMPAGYDTLIGERGVTLSGGEKQRLAIARALLKNAPILILDEATSSLDAESEYEVQKALENLVKGRTTFVIAHRLSTIIHADRILVIENGRIAEIGCHAELMRQNGVYRRLYMIQFQGRGAV